MALAITMNWWPAPGHLLPLFLLSLSALVPLMSASMGRDAGSSRQPPQPQNAGGLTQPLTRIGRVTIEQVMTPDEMHQIHQQLFPLLEDQHRGVSPDVPIASTSQDLWRTSQLLRQHRITFDGTDALLIGPGPGLQEIRTVLEVFPTLSALHILRAADVSYPDDYGSMSSPNLQANVQPLMDYLSRRHLATDLKLYAGTVLSLPEWLKRGQIKLAIMNNVVDVTSGLFSTQQAEWAYREIAATMPPHGVLIAGGRFQVSPIGIFGPAEKTSPFHFVSSLGQRNYGALFVRTDAPASSPEGERTPNPWRYGRLVLSLTGLGLALPQVANAAGLRGLMESPASGVMAWLTSVGVPAPLVFGLVFSLAVAGSFWGWWNLQVFTDRKLRWLREPLRRLIRRLHDGVWQWLAPAPTTAEVFDRQTKQMVKLRYVPARQLSDDQQAIVAASGAEWLGRRPPVRHQSDLDWLLWLLLTSFRVKANLLEPFRLVLDDQLGLHGFVTIRDEWTVIEIDPRHRISGGYQGVGPALAAATLQEWLAEALRSGRQRNPTLTITAPRSSIRNLLARVLDRSPSPLLPVTLSMGEVMRLLQEYGVYLNRLRQRAQRAARKETPSPAVSAWWGRLRRWAGFSIVAAIALILGGVDPVSAAGAWLAPGLGAVGAAVVEPGMGAVALGVARGGWTIWSNHFSRFVDMAGPIVGGGPMVVRILLGVGLAVAAGTWFAWSWLQRRLSARKTEASLSRQVTRLDGRTIQAYFEGTEGGQTPADAARPTHFSGAAGRPSGTPDDVRAPGPTPPVVHPAGTPLAPEESAWSDAIDSWRTSRLRSERAP